MKFSAQQVKKKVQAEAYEEQVREKIASSEYVGVQNVHVGNNPAPCWSMLNIVKAANNSKPLADAVLLYTKYNMVSLCWTLSLGVYE